MSSYQEIVDSIQGDYTPIGSGSDEQVTQQPQTSSWLGRAAKKIRGPLASISRMAIPLLLLGWGAYSTIANHNSSDRSTLGKFALGVGVDRLLKELQLIAKSRVTANTLDIIRVMNTIATCFSSVIRSERSSGPDDKAPTFHNIHELIQKHFQVASSLIPRLDLVPRSNAWYTSAAWKLAAWGMLLDGKKATGCANTPKVDWGEFSALDAKTHKYTDVEGREHSVSTCDHFSTPDKPLKIATLHRKISALSEKEKEKIVKHLQFDDHLSGDKLMKIVSEIGVVANALKVRYRYETSSESTFKIAQPDVKVPKLTVSDCFRSYDNIYDAMHDLIQKTLKTLIDMKKIDSEDITDPDIQRKIIALVSLKALKNVYVDERFSSKRLWFNKETVFQFGKRINMNPNYKKTYEDDPYPWNYVNAWTSFDNGYTAVTDEPFLLAKYLQKLDTDYKKIEKSIEESLNSTDEALTKIEGMDENNFSCLNSVINIVIKRFFNPYAHKFCNTFQKYEKDRNISTIVQKKKKPKIQRFPDKNGSKFEEELSKEFDISSNPLDHGVQAGDCLAGAFYQAVSKKTARRRDITFWRSRIANYILKYKTFFRKHVKIAEKGQSKESNKFLRMSSWAFSESDDIKAIDLAIKRKCHKIKTGTYERGSGYIDDSKPEWLTEVEIEVFAHIMHRPVIIYSKEPDYYELVNGKLRSRTFCVCYKNKGKPYYFMFDGKNHYLQMEKKRSEVVFEAMGFLKPLSVFVKKHS